MTSKQVMLTAIFLGTLLNGVGCSVFQGEGADPLNSPYPSRRVWAVAPLVNESGSAYADGFALADQLIRQLEGASNLDVIPLNRTIAGMEASKLQAIATPGQAQILMGALGVDGLIVGSVTAYDPYDPPKLGMAIELYSNDRVERQDFLDVRGLTKAATDPNGQATGKADAPNIRRVSDRFDRPVSTISAVLDAESPETIRMMKRFAENRGRLKQDHNEAWHRYRISMHLYSEFVSYVISWRLLRSETDRWNAIRDHAATVTSGSAP